ncbi:MAG: ANTAR domain-containing protein [Methylophaga sp.]|nr:ANTAR domain-containing protein [Methylophaga sp.]
MLNSIDSKTATSFNTLVFCDKPLLSRQLQSALVDTDYQVTHCAETLQALLAVPLTDEPTVLLMAVEECHQDLLKLLKLIHQQRPMPVVVFTSQYDDSELEEAIDAGVSAYIVDGLQPQRLIPVLKLAQARFRKNQLLEKQLSELKTALEDRKVIERAKGMIMQQRKCSEDEAYRLIRTAAMNQNMRMAALARNILSSSDYRWTAE